MKYKIGDILVNSDIENLLDEDDEDVESEKETKSSKKSILETESELNINDPLESSDINSVIENFIN